jgi:polyhydroxybutyrate depolymerase
MRRYLMLFVNLLAVQYYCLSFSQEKVIYVTDKINPNVVYSRSYYLHLPTNYSDTTDYPLVLGFHGRGGTGQSWSVTPLWKDKSDSENFIVAFPSAIDGLWNPGGGYEVLTNNRDDVEFVSVLIDTLCSFYKIDPTKIYAAGLSNGGHMVYRLADELSHKISSIAPVAAKMAYYYFTAEFPVGIIHFHSLYDNTVPYEGAIFVISVFDFLQSWAYTNNCNPRPDTVDYAFGIKKISWHAIDSHGDINLYTIDNSEHAWPSGYISATDIIWDFFESHSRNYSTTIHRDKKAVKKVTFDLFQNYPNPFNPVTTIKYNLPESKNVTLKIYNLAGQEIETLVFGFQTAGEHQIAWQPKGLPSGIYFYRLQTDQFLETRKLIFQK